MTRVYVASNIPTGYPYKLQKPASVNSNVRETAESFIMDSGIGDDVSNEEVLDLAHDYNADYVIAKDYLHDQDRTTESVREFFDLYDGHPCDATPMVPLQPPFHEHYPDLPDFDHYVLGGMAAQDVSTGEQASWIRKFRQVEPDAYAHALGVGGSMGFVRQIAGEGFLDALDCSTPEMAAMYGRVIDSDLSQSSVRVYSGEGARLRNTPLAEFNSWQLADVWRRECSESPQRSVTDF